MQDFSNPFLFHDHKQGDGLGYPGAGSSSNFESESDALAQEKGPLPLGSRTTLYIQVSKRSFYVYNLSLLICIVVYQL